MIALVVGVLVALAFAGSLGAAVVAAIAAVRAQAHAADARAEITKLFELVEDATASELHARRLLDESNRDREDEIKIFRNQVIQLREGYARLLKQIRQQTQGRSRMSGGPERVQ